MAPAKRTTPKYEPYRHAVQTQRTKAFEGTREVECDPSVKSEDILESIYDAIPLKQRTALSPKDLPPECLRGFRVAFRPAIRDFAGTLGPWESPDDADIVRIWNYCFPKHRLDVSRDLFKTVSKLVDDTLLYWRRGIATTAVNYLNMHLKSSFNKEPERLARAAWLLGDDEKDRRRPFYYKKYGNGIRPSGIFQSQFIAATLATHLSSISYLPEQSRSLDYPIGALALSILAVKRALTWAKTGIEPIPNMPEGNFSRANWGDHYKLEDGRYVIVKSASNVVAVVNKLQDGQWERILIEAGKFATGKNKSAVSKGPLVEETENQSDFDIEDWDE